MKYITLLLLTLFTMCTNNNNNSAPVTHQQTDTDAVPEQNRSLDPSLYGEWVNTEILGAGTEMSMTNESLMEFLEDGTCLSWQGRSIGPNYSKDEDKSEASKGNWYTDGNMLHLVEPASGKEVAIEYSVNANGLLISDGGKEKKLLSRR